ncbi:MAG: hypothetical protein J6V57_06220 [Spirochaetaceae bacterium]|nr:hypothetical protein [Spirochaetaceae bacterium]
MKRFIFPSILCLCLLMLSCSSTPPAQEVVPEEVIQEPVQSQTVLEQELEQEPRQADSEQEEPILEQDALQQSDSELNQEQDENNIVEEPSAESPSLDTIAALDNSIPLDEGASSEADLEVIVQDDSQDYLQEIEIIDLFQEDDLSAGYNQEDMAVVVEDNTAVVVEQLPELNENPASQETESPVVAESTAQTEPVIVEAEVDEQLSMETENSEPLDQETEALESVAIEAEAIEPVDIDATQGVLDDFVVPSRSVAMDKEQYLDIRYPGTGWVYLGEVTKDGTSIGTPSLTYFGRRRTSEDTSFTMKSTKPGTTILHFYKQDVLTATFIDDYLEVTITDAIAQNGFRVIAPSYESLVPGYQDTIPQPKDFPALVSSEKTQETTQSIPKAEEPLPVAPSQAQSVATQNQSPVQDSTPATTASSVASVPREPTPSATAAPSPTEPATWEASPAVTAVSREPTPATTASSVAPVSREPTPSATAAPSPSEPATREASPAVTAAPSSVASVPREPTPSATAAPSPTEPATREASPAATVVVPPQTTTPRTVERNSPAQVSTLQQETYQPESPSNTISQDNFNPETGMSMENMDLPWVSEELERQRTADINRGTLYESPEEIDSSQQQAQDMLLAQAQDYFHAEDHPAALETLNKFFEIAISDFDAAYYLKGQVLESKSSIKNVKEAQKAYKHVIDSYPQSPFWERAKNRYTYLSRFYFDIR